MDTKQNQLLAPGLQKLLDLGNTVITDIQTYLSAGPGNQIECVKNSQHESAYRSLQVKNTKSTLFKFVAEEHKEKFKKKCDGYYLRLLHINSSLPEQDLLKLLERCGQQKDTRPMLIKMGAESPFTYYVYAKPINSQGNYVLRELNTPKSLAQLNTLNFNYETQFINSSDGYRDIWKEINSKNAFDINWLVGPSTPKRFAFGSLLFKGGNCQEYASLTYLLLRGKAFTKNFPINIAYCYLWPKGALDKDSQHNIDGKTYITNFSNASHFCVAIGYEESFAEPARNVFNERKLESVDSIEKHPWYGKGIVIVDPWPTKAKAVLFDNYFCNDRAISVNAFKKPAEKYANQTLESLLKLVSGQYNKKYGIELEEVKKEAEKNCAHKKLKSNDAIENQIQDGCVTPAYNLSLMSDLNGDLPTLKYRVYLEKTKGEAISYSILWNQSDDAKTRTTYTSSIEQNELKDATEDQFNALDNNNIKTFEVIRDSIFSVTSQRGHTGTKGNNNMFHELVCHKSDKSMPS